RFSQLPQLLAAFSSIERKNWMQTDFGRAVRLPIVQALLGQTQEAKISLKSMFEQLVSSPQQAIPVNIEQYRVFMKTFEQKIFHDS
ncbi:MAG: hypothetical protein JNK65_02860, partial [Deltaproteobacteria bacterium]|nr:hypothetical protein [Deltaproteobacteria bacterium]